jgi:hypothetical protein
MHLLDGHVFFSPLAFTKRLISLPKVVVLFLHKGHLVGHYLHPLRHMLNSLENRGLGASLMPTNPRFHKGSLRKGFSWVVWCLRDPRVSVDPRGASRC